MGCCMALAMLDWWRSHGREFVWGGWNDYNSPLVLLSAVFLFCFVMTLRKCPWPIQRLLSAVSRLSFGAYLTSWIWDSVVYEHLNEAIPNVPLRLDWMPVVVGVVLVCSLASSWIIARITKLVIEYSKWNRRVGTYSRVTTHSSPWQVVSLTLLTGVSLFLLWKWKYGFGNIDECFYLTIPLRLCQGDSLVGQEWHLSLLSSIFLVVPMKLQLMLWGGTEGVVLHFRYLFTFAWITSGLFCVHPAQECNALGCTRCSSGVFVICSVWNNGT